MCNCETQSATKSFDECLAAYRQKYDEAFEIYGRYDEDDDLLGQACDSARMIYLSAALNVATTKDQCRTLLGHTQPRNIELIDKINQKMNALTE